MLVLARDFNRKNNVVPADPVFHTPLYTEESILLALEQHIVKLWCNNSEFFLHNKWCH